jgi:hypothetical protein
MARPLPAPQIFLKQQSLVGGCLAVLSAGRSPKVGDMKVKRFFLRFFSFAAVPDASSKKVLIRNRFVVLGMLESSTPSCASTSDPDRFMKIPLRGLPIPPGFSNLLFVERAGVVLGFTPK